MNTVTTHFGGRRGIGPVLIVMIVFAPPIPVLAQAGVVVEGRVLEADGAGGIQNAIVELEGHDATRTSALGGFRFVNVDPGRYTLRVQALGYTPNRLGLTVDRDMSVTVYLDAAPVQLDPVFVVAPRTIDLEGRIRDPANDLRLEGADILTDRGHRTETDFHGRFSLEVVEDVPLTVGIRAFGYLPVDTLLLPGEADSYVFDLAVDPVIEGLIAREITRIHERAGGLLAGTMQPMTREDLLRRRSYTLRDLLLTKFPRRGRRIRCVIVDEKVVTGMRADFLLSTLVTQEVERMEFLFRGAMLRIYTREFLRTMIGGGLQLRPATYVNAPRPFCS